VKLRGTKLGRCEPLRPEPFLKGQLSVIASLNRLLQERIEGHLLSKTKSPVKSRGEDDDGTPAALFVAEARIEGEPEDVASVRRSDHYRISRP
jgi:hypothetical protein